MVLMAGRLVQALLTGRAILPIWPGRKVWMIHIFVRWCFMVVPRLGAARECPDSQIF
jgi:hypothetical protein